MTLAVLAFFAHPDDETMLCGGTLALLTRLGANVHGLIATRGEGGEMGDPPLSTRETLGAVRENELRCAAAALGMTRLDILDYVDPTIGPGDTMFAYTEDIDRLTGEIVEAIKRYKIDAILTHGVNGEYGHPAHTLSHRAVQQAVQALRPEAPLFYSVQGIFPGHPYPRLANADAPAHMVINIKAVIKDKTDAAMCHQTQHALFIRHRSEEAGRTMTIPEVIMPVESLHRVWPPVAAGTEPEDLLADLLWASGFVSSPPNEPS